MVSCSTSKPKDSTKEKTGKKGRKARIKEKQDAREQSEDPLLTEEASIKEEDSKPSGVPEGQAKIKGTFCGELALNKHIFQLLLPLDNFVSLEVITQMIGGFVDQAKVSEQKEEAKRMVMREEEQAQSAQRMADEAIEAAEEGGQTKKSRLSSLLPCCFAASDGKPKKREGEPERDRDALHKELGQKSKTLSAESWTSMRAILEVEGLSGENTLMEACVNLVAGCKAVPESEYEKLADVLRRRTQGTASSQHINRFSLFEAFHSVGVPSAHIIDVATAHKHVSCLTTGDDFVRRVRERRQQVEAGAPDHECHVVAMDKMLRSGEPTEEDARVIFDMFDADKDGKISKDEFWSGFVSFVPHVQEHSESVIKALQAEFDIRGKRMKELAHQLKTIKRENKEFKRRENHQFFKELGELVGHSKHNELRLEDLEDYNDDPDLEARNNAVAKAREDAKRKDAAKKKKERNEKVGATNPPRRPRTSKLSSCMPALFPPLVQSKNENAKEEDTDGLQVEQAKQAPVEKKRIDLEPVPEGKVMIEGTFQGSVTTCKHRLEMMLPMDGYIPMDAWLLTAGGLADTAMEFKSMYRRKGAEAETMEETWREIAGRHGSREMQAQPGAEHHCIATPISRSVGSPASGLSPASPVRAARTEFDEHRDDCTAREQRPMSAARTMESVNDEVDRLLEKLQAMRGSG